MKKIWYTGVIIGLVGCQSLHPVDDRSMANNCNNNLRAIETAACCAGRDKQAQPGDPVDTKVMIKYLKGGEIPKCPKGCEYVIPSVYGPGRDASPKCPYHGTQEDLRVLLNKSTHETANQSFEHTR